MRKISLFLLVGCLVLLLNACSASNCKTEQEIRSGNFITGEQQRIATVATFCTDKGQYNKGDTVHITFTVKNALDKQIVLDGGQQPVMDICVWWTKQCLSQAQPAVAGLTRLVLEPGQSHTIQWDWPTPEVNVKEAVDHMNRVAIDAYWLGTDGMQGKLQSEFFYGERLGGP